MEQEGQWIPLDHLQSWAKHSICNVYMCVCVPPQQEREKDAMPVSFPPQGINASLSLSHSRKGMEGSPDSVS